MGTFGNIKRKLQKYQYEEYWKNRGRTYYNKFVHSEGFKAQESLLIQILKSHENPIQFDSVFEVGCGFGRITKIIEDNFHPKQYDALDISEQQIEHAKKLTKNVNYILSDFSKFTSTQEYDLVIISEVLMHIPDPLIEEFVIKALKMSKKFLITIDIAEKKNLPDSKHMTYHNYNKLFSNFSHKEHDTGFNQLIHVIRK